MLPVCPAQERSAESGRRIEQFHILHKLDYLIENQTPSDPAGLPADRSVPKPNSKYASAFMLIPTRYEDAPIRQKTEIFRVAARTIPEQTLGSASWETAVIVPGTVLGDKEDAIWNYLTIFDLKPLFVMRETREPSLFLSKQTTLRTANSEDSQDLLLRPNLIQSDLTARSQEHQKSD
jgi:hypothetical protein